MEAVACGPRATPQDELKTMIERTAKSSDQSSPTAMERRQGHGGPNVVALFAIASIGAGLLFGKLRNSDNGENARAASAPRRDARSRQLVVGTWKRHLYGNRTLTVRKNGTATMVIKPDAVWSVLFGERLQIEIAWKIKGGRLIYHSKGGKPADKVASAQQMWGDHWDEKILELTDERLSILNSDGQTQSNWTRVKVGAR